MSVKDLTEQVFGRWTVVRQDGVNKHGQATWLCRCSCARGTERAVGSFQLRSGKSRDPHQRQVAPSRSPRRRRRRGEFRTLGVDLRAT